MNQNTQLKIALGIILAVAALPLMVLFSGPAGFVAGPLMLAAGIALIVLGIRSAAYKRPELQDFPDEVVIGGVHYPKSAFTRVNTCIRGRETVFAINELRQITGISPEQAREIVNNWKQYYKE